MQKNRVEQLREALEIVKLTGDHTLHAMHLAEIEEEALTALDLLASLVTHARQKDEDGVETLLIELTLSLKHLSHHTQALLPVLEKEIGLVTEDDSLNPQTELVTAV